MSRDRAFRVVADFEAALCEFTGAPYCVTVDSCTNAIYLALTWYARGPWKQWCSIPTRTYIGVRQAALNAGYEVKFRDNHWTGEYQLAPTSVYDSAKQFRRDMYRDNREEAHPLVCVSFQAGKLLPIGRGGAILTDNADAADWLRKARLDGRTAGADYHDNTYQQFGAHCYLDPPSAARGLWLMTYLEDDDDGSWREYPDLSEATWV